ncbi:MAG: hypothetical protein V1886_01380 [archaeon]
MRAKRQGRSKRRFFYGIILIVLLGLVLIFSAKSPPPLKNMKGIRAKKPDIDCINLWKEEFKRYILEEIKKGNKYPSGEEIAKHFGISHIWNIVKVSELYKELNLKPYLERERRITSVQEP